jgi:flagellar biosynthesis protein FliP
MLMLTWAALGVASAPTSAAAIAIAVIARRIIAMPPLETAESRRAKPSRPRALLIEGNSIRDAR